MCTTRSWTTWCVGRKSEQPAARFIAWLGITPSKFHTWKDRYGTVNEHNGKVPRDFWIEVWEQRASTTGAPSMTEPEVEVITQRTQEMYPPARPK